MRPIALGRKNWLFAGADTGGETLARAMTLIETAKMNGLNPEAWLADVLDRIHGQNRKGRMNGVRKQLLDHRPGRRNDP